MAGRAVVGRAVEGMAAEGKAAEDKAEVQVGALQEFLDREQSKVLQQFS